MNEKGFSLVEVMISIGLLGVVGLGVSSYMNKLQADAAVLGSRFEMIQLRNALRENFNTTGECKDNMTPLFQSKGLILDPAKSYNGPLTVEQLNFPENHVVIAGKTVFGEVLIEKMELISSTQAPFTPLMKISSVVGKAYQQEVYRTLLRVTVKKANKLHSSLMFPIIFTIANNQLESCRIGSSSVPTTSETCSSILREGDQSAFLYDQGNCKMKINDKNVQIKSPDANENILCQLQKKIQQLRPLNTNLVQHHCL